MSNLLEKINQSKKLVPIGDLCSRIFSGGTPTTTSSNFWNGGIPWLSSGETRNDFINITEKTITKEGVDNSSTKLALKNDVVIATAGQGLTRGQVSYLNIDTYINQSVISLRANPEKLDSRYLYYNLKSRYTELRSLSDDTSSRGSITIPILSRMKIDAHDLLTQKQIASILSAYDEKIENNNKIIKNLEATAQTIFNEWFVNFRFPGYKKVKFVDSEMGEIPEGWKVKNVLDVIERISPGKKYDNKSASPSGRVPILDQGASGFIGYHDDEPGVIASIDNPVVVFTNHTCYYRILTEPFSCIQNVLPYVGKNGYDTFFVYFLTKEKIKMSEYKGHWPEFEQQVFVIPTPEIANQFSKMAKVFIEKIVICEKENISLKSQRDLLLAKLI